MPVHRRSPLLNADACGHGRDSENHAPATKMKRLGQTPRGLTLFLLYGQYLSCEEAGSSRGAPMRGIGIEAPRPTEPRRDEGHPAPATRMKWAGLRQGSAFSLNVRLRETGPNDILGLKGPFSIRDAAAIMAPILDAMRVCSVRNCRRRRKRLSAACSRILERTS